jgi:hypothetical protein
MQENFLKGSRGKLLKDGANRSVPIRRHRCRSHRADRPGLAGGRFRSQSAGVPVPLDGWTALQEHSHNLVLTAQAAAALRADFLGWQCRIRQLSMRQGGGRPTPGMRPRVLTADGDALSPGIVVLIVEREPAGSTALFRHQYLKTNDPIERYDKILEILAGSYFQQPGRFADVLTASFGSESAVAKRLLIHGRCILAFEQYAQAYRLPCRVAELATEEDFYQATYWHNHMFNPNMPPGLRILAFTPDWTHAAGWQIDGE